MSRPPYHNPTPEQGEMTYLMHYARWANVGGVKYELAGGADVNAQDKSGYTALFWNCGEGNRREKRQRQRIFRLLINAGASLEITDTRGWNVLRHTRYFGSWPMRRFVTREFARRNKK